MANAAPRWEFCGDEQPHERHEFIRGARRYDCPGAPTLESRIAEGAEFPDVPVRPGPSAAQPSRPSELSVCRCGAPLIATFHWRSKEWVCLECGRLYAFLNTPSAETTDELWARYEALLAEWKEHAPKLLTPGAKHEDCEKCWGPDADSQHIDHATAAERAAHEEATSWLLTRTGRA